jgi:DNA-binding response OmpR family regulator
MSFPTALIVEDFEPLRILLCSKLQESEAFKVVYQASDGLEAVQKAAELQPDLVLLDLVLPKLNGIEVAKRVRKMAPGAAILFVSQEPSVEFVREALRVGALGYVHKSHIGTELLPAIRAVLEGRRFVSAKAGCNSIRGMDPRVPVRHEVQFYSDDRVFLMSVARFVATALKAGNPAVVLATESHCDELRPRLQAEGVDVDSAVQKGLYVVLNAADALSTFMVDGWPDPVRFRGFARGLIQSASVSAEAHRPVVAAFGEMVAILWAEGKTDAAIRLEELWNEVITTHDVNLLCAYPFANFGAEREAMSRMCAAHSTVSYL